MLNDLKRTVCEMNQALPRHGLVTMTSGNVSAMDGTLRYMVIKPSGVPFDRLKPSDMSVVDMEGRVKDGPHSPSVDALSHLIVYRKRPDIRGIVHTHSNYATAFAVAGKPLPVLMTAMADEFGETVPVSRFASSDPDAVGKAMVETLGSRKVPAVLIRNHGVFTFGPSALAAVKAAVMIEDIAKTCWLALQVGKPRVIPPKDVRKYYDRYHRIYGQSGRRNTVYFKVR